MSEILESLVVSLRGDLDNLRRDLREATQETAKAGQQAGQAFGSEFGRSSGGGMGGAIRDEKGRFVAQGREAGQEAGRAFGMAFRMQVSEAAQESSKVLAGVLATVGVAAATGATGLVKLAGEAEQAQVAFTTLLGSAEKAQTFIAGLRDFAARTPFEMAGLQDASRKLLAFGFTAEQIIPMLTSIGDAVGSLGGGADEIGRVTLALGQMQAKGKVSAEEMNQLAELGIPVWKMLSDQIGVSIPKAMKMAEQGAISAATAIPALLQGMSAKFGGGMDAQSKTLLGMWSTTMDNMKTASVQAGEAIVEAFNLKGVLSEFNATLGQLPAMLDKLDLRQWAQDNSTALAAVGGAITAALIPAAIAGATALAAFMAPLLPFMAAGAAIALTLKAMGVGMDDVRRGFEQARQALAPFGEMLRGLASQVEARMMPVFQTIGEAARQGFGAVRGFAEGILLPALASLAPLVTPILARLGDVLAGVAESARAAFALVGRVVENVLIPAFERIWPVVQPILTALLKGIEAALGLVAGAFRTTGKLLSGDWAGAWQDILATVSSFGVKIQAALDGMADKLIPAGKKLGGYIWEGLQGSLDGLQALFLDAIANAIEALRDQLPASLRGVADGLINGARAGADANRPADVTLNRLPVQGPQQGGAANLNIPEESGKFGYAFISSLARVFKTDPKVASDCAVIAFAILDELGAKIKGNKYQNANAGVLEQNAIASGFEKVGGDEIKPGDLIVWTSGNGKKYGAVSGKHVGVAAGFNSKGQLMVINNPGDKPTVVEPMYDRQNAVAYRAPTSPFASRPVSASTTGPASAATPSIADVFGPAANVAPTSAEQKKFNLTLELWNKLKGRALELEVAHAKAIKDGNDAARLTIEAQMRVWAGDSKARQGALAFAKDVNARMASDADKAAQEDGRRTKEAAQRRARVAEAARQGDIKLAEQEAGRLEQMRENDLRRAGDNAEKRRAVELRYGNEIYLARKAIAEKVYSDAMGDAARGPAQEREQAELIAKNTRTAALEKAEADKNGRLIAARKAVEQAGKDAKAQALKDGEEVMQAAERFAAEQEARDERRAAIRARVADERRQLDVAARRDDLAQIEELNRQELAGFKGTAEQRLAMIRQNAKDEYDARVALAREVQRVDLEKSANQGGKNQGTRDARINAAFTQAELQARGTRDTAVQAAEKAKTEAERTEQDKRKAQQQAAYAVIRAQRDQDLQLAEGSLKKLRDLRDADLKAAGDNAQKRLEIERQYASDERKTLETAAQIRFNIAKRAAESGDVKLKDGQLALAQQKLDADMREAAGLSRVADAQETLTGKVRALRGQYSSLADSIREQIAAGQFDDEAKQKATKSFNALGLAARDAGLYENEHAVLARKTAWALIDQGQAAADLIVQSRERIQAIRDAAAADDEAAQDASMTIPVLTGMLGELIAQELDPRKTGFVKLLEELIQKGGEAGDAAKYVLDNLSGLEADLGGNSLAAIAERGRRAMQAAKDASAAAPNTDPTLEDSLSNEVAGRVLDEVFRQPETTEGKFKAAIAAIATDAFTDMGAAGREAFWEQFDELLASPEFKGIGTAALEDIEAGLRGSTEWADLRAKIRSELEVRGEGSAASPSRGPSTEELKARADAWAQVMRSERVEEYRKSLEKLDLAQLETAKSQAMLAKDTERYGIITAEITRRVTDETRLKSLTREVKELTDSLDSGERGLEEYGNQAGPLSVKLDRLAVAAQAASKPELAQAYAMLAAELRNLIPVVGEAADKLDDLAQGAVAFGEGLASIFNAFGMGEWGKLSSSIGGLFKTVQDGQKAFSAIGPAFSKSFGAGLGAVGSFLGVVGAGINLVGQIGDAILNLSPAFRAWKKNLLEVAELQGKAASMNGGLLGNPYAAALKEDAGKREQLANAGFWKRAWWAISGSAPKVMEEGAARLKSQAAEIFADLGQTISNTLEGSLMDAFLKADFSGVEEAMNKALDTFVVKAAIQAVIKKSQLTQLVEAYADEAARGGDTSDEAAAIRAEMGNVNRAFQGIAPGLPGYGSGADGGLSGSGQSGSLFGNAPGVQLGIPRIEVTLPDSLMRPLGEFATAVPIFSAASTTMLQAAQLLLRLGTGNGNPPPLSGNGAL